MNEKQKSGNYEIKFNGSDLPSGVYFYSLKVGEHFSTNKTVLMK